MKIQIPFIGGAYKADSLNINAQECINLYPVVDAQQEPAVVALVGIPGCKQWVDIGVSVEIRGMIEFDGYIYAVCGDTVYKISSSGAKTALSTTLDTSTGPVWMEHNGLEVMITDDTYGYLVNSDVVSKITDADFPTPSSLTYQDGYFIVTEKDTGRYWLSALLDGSSWNALDYTTSEGLPDDAVSCLMANRELWNFGEISTEIYYNSGASDFPFERLPNGFFKTGIGAAHSAVNMDNSVFWFTDKRQVVVASNYSPVIISTPQIDAHFSRMSTVSDAIGFAYTQMGHTFYQLTFPTEGETWVYDAATRLWHQRKSYKSGSVTDGRHRANCYFRFNGKHLVGDYNNGKIYELDPDTYEDNGEVKRWKRTCQYIQKNGERVFFANLQLFFESGVGLVTGQGDDPEVMLKWSDDGGHTWSNEHWANIGAIGEYGHRTIWRRLGKSRSRTFSIEGTDPVKTVIIKAVADIS